MFSVESFFCLPTSVSFLSMCLITEYFEEVLSLISSLTSQQVSLRMWMILPLLSKQLYPGNLDYFPGKIINSFILNNSLASVLLLCQLSVFLRRESLSTNNFWIITLVSVLPRMATNYHMQAYESH